MHAFQTCSSSPAIFALSSLSSMCDTLTRTDDDLEALKCKSFISVNQGLATVIISDSAHCSIPPFLHPLPGPLLWWTHILHGMRVKEVPDSHQLLYSITFIYSLQLSLVNWTTFSKIANTSSLHSSSMGRKKKLLYQSKYLRSHLQFFVNSLQDISLLLFKGKVAPSVIRKDMYDGLHLLEDALCYR